MDKNFINKMYQYMRCICSVMLQDKVYDFGFDGTTVELGIVSLGTSTADGTKKAVKVSSNKRKLEFVSFTIQVKVISIFWGEGIFLR